MSEFTPDEYMVRQMYTMKRRSMHNHISPDYDAEFDRFIAKVKADALRRARQRIVDALPDAPSKAQEGRMKYAIGFLGVLADEVEGGDRDEH